MMFIMPTPPTTREINATTNSKTLIDWVVEESIFDHFGHIADAEVVFVARGDAVTLAQQLGDLAHRLFDLGFGSRLGHNLVHVGETDRLRVIGGLDGRTRGIQRRCGGIKAAQRIDSIAGGRRTAAGTALWFVLVRVVPLTRYLIVVQGANTMLS